MRSLLVLSFAFATVTLSMNAQVDTNFAKNFEAAMRLALDSAGNDAGHTIDSSIDNTNPPSLAECIEHPSHILVLMIDLSKTPLDSLPSDFDELNDLEVLIILNAPVTSAFNINQALSTIATMTSLQEVYIVNNRSRLQHPPYTLADMPNLHHFLAYNNSFTIEQGRK